MASVTDAKLIPGPWRDAGATHRPLRDRLRRRALGLSDVLATALTLVAWAQIENLPLLTSGVVVAITTVFVLLRLSGLHDKDELVLRRSTLDEAPRLAEAAALAACAYWLMLPQGPGRAPLLTLTLMEFLLLFGLRTSTRFTLRLFSPQERCLFVGDMSLAEAVRSKVDQSPANAVVVGALPLTQASDARTIGGVAGFRQLVGELHVTRVILAPVSVSATDTLDLIRVAKEAHVRVSIFPRLVEVVGTAVEYEDLEGMMLMGVKRFGLSPSARRIKRTFDIVCAGIATVAAAPLMIVIALAVRLDSRGPVFFRQTRVGRDGVQFDILKFRSMVNEAETLKEGLRHRNETTGLFKIAADPRVTRVGRFLRTTSLDELPQLLNVMKGDMSLVGPRPLVVDEDEQVYGLDRRRLHLTPGMTGPWQILRSGRVPIREMVSIDYRYVSTWSLWTDVKILLRTMAYVLGRHGL